MANIEELDRALKWIEENPERHDQRVWIERTPCGTAMCLAGVVAMLNGWKPLFRTTGGTCDVELATTVEDLDGKKEAVSTVAMLALDLRASEASRLFFQDNDLDDLKRFRDELAADEPEWRRQW